MQQNRQITKRTLTQKVKQVLYNSTHLNSGKEKPWRTENGFLGCSELGKGLELKIELQRNDSKKYSDWAFLHPWVDCDHGHVTIHICPKS